MSRANSQKIDCTVSSCAYNKRGEMCALEAIVVQPCANCTSGNPEDESMCGSYRAIT